MDKLRKLVEEHSHWSSLIVYIERIETFAASDFSLALENAKALLESIGKEICQKNNASLGMQPSTNDILKKAFSCLGYANSDLVNLISRSLARIGQEMGNLRNEISATAHGRTMQELTERNNRVDALTQGFLIDSTALLAVFLIRAHEHKKADLYEMILADSEPVLEYEDASDFNDNWDETYGEFAMGSYSYPASEILYRVDIMAYKTEYAAFVAEDTPEVTV